MAIDLETRTVRRGKRPARKAQAGICVPGAGIAGTSAALEPPCATG